MNRMKCIIRPVLPVIIGFFIGVMLSLLIGPFLKSAKGGGCSMNMPGAGFKNEHFINSAELKKSFNYGNSEDFEPRIKPVVTDNQQAQVKQSDYKKPTRPRYAATELGIREKLFIGVVSSKESIDTFGVAVNRTVSHYVPKLVFFTNDRNPDLPSGLSVVVFTNEAQYRVAFQIFNYIKDHYMNSHDWYYITSDHTYTRAEKLMDLVSHMSIIHEIYMGSPNAAAYCTLDGGILLSSAVIKKVIENLDQCVRSPGDESRDIGKCIQLAAMLNCSDYDISNDRRAFLTHKQNGEFSYNRDIRSALQRTDFPNLLTVASVKDDASVYRLHRYFCEVDLNKTFEDIEKVKQDILKSAAKGPGGLASLTWPLGVDPPVPPKTRFHVIRWQYFTEAHLFMPDDFHNMQPLVGVDKLDVQDVLKVTVERLNEKYNNRFIYSRLVNGYRRFDPVRGMEYTIDVMLKDKILKQEVFKRAHLMRPLTQVEFVPIPYVTESSRVNLVLPVNIKDKDSTVSFLDTYAHVCLESGDSTFLYVVFIYDDINRQNAHDDVFSVIKSMITFYESKYQTGSKIAWVAVQNSDPSQFTILDAVTRKFSKDTLFLLGDPGMELSIDFLNRVRMNTINQWQVFFPIAFWQYKPNLIYAEKPYPTNIDISSKTGFFDVNTYIHASFYNGDYQYARKQMMSTSASQKIDLIEMFLKYHNLHVFRAVEPTLKHKYRERVCTATMEENEYQRCLVSRAEGLASKSQLALLVFEHQKNLDKAHLNVIHQNQQKGPQVDQMNPNMLRKK